MRCRMNFRFLPGQPFCGSSPEYRAVAGEMDEDSSSCTAGLILDEDGEDCTKKLNSFAVSGCDLLRPLLRPLGEAAFITSVKDAA